MSIFDTCTDACGWVFAFVAAVSYGSYGVPIKYTKHIDVHPLILQSYKTFVMFVSCWGVDLLGEGIAFTRWGLLSGFMWIIGGVGGIYGIRNAGLAIAVGTWASIMIIINFFFGIIVFEEPVADIWGTLCSFLLLIAGLIGMSHYSSPKQNRQQVEQEIVLLEDTQDDLEPGLNIGETTNYQSMHPTDDAADGIQEIEPHIVLFGGFISLTKRQCGIGGAVVNGFMTGGSLIPLHYAGQEGFGGAKYFPSFGVGAMIANILLWVLFYLVCMCKDILRGESIKGTFGKLPKLHFRALWFPGLLAGLMLSLAMFSTIIAITYLGQGVGNSVVQSKILISGLWGIFWFKEVVGAKTVAKWFASAGLCIFAIIWLSLERLEAKNGKN